MTRTNYFIHKRNFKASQYPKNSETRRLLNEDVLTSEYMRSYKWQVKMLLKNLPLTECFRTLKEAQQYILERIKN